MRLPVYLQILSTPVGKRGIFPAMSFFPQLQDRAQDLDPEQSPRPKRPWSAKFGDALRGLKLGIRGHSSFSVHFFFSALVLAAAIILQCRLEQWCLLLMCIGLVLTAELFNSALETLIRGLDENTRAKTWQCLDISAGAVLMASVVAIVVGTAIFLDQLMAILD